MGSSFAVRINLKSGFLALSCMAVSCSAFGDSGLGIADWGKTIPVSPALVAQMNEFKKDGQSLDPAYIERTAQSIQDLIVARSNDQVQALLAHPDRCNADTKTDFMNPGFLNNGKSDGLSPAEKDFESGFIRVEATACLKGGNASEALGIFMDPEFRKSAIPQLASSSRTGNSICEATEAISSILSVSATDYCVDLAQNNEAGEDSLLLTLDSNNASPGVQPVYFRQTLISFVNTPGGVAAHILIYARSQKVNTGFFGIDDQITGHLNSAQKTAFAELQKRLQH